jgi:hypothetical protein
MVSPQDMQELQDLQAARRKRSEAVAELEAHFASADTHLTPAARELTDEDLLLRALIERESARRLARQGRTEAKYA